MMASIDGYVKLSSTAKGEIWFHHFPPPSTPYSLPQPTNLLKHELFMRCTSIASDSTFSSELSALCLHLAVPHCKSHWINTCRCCLQYVVIHSIRLVDQTSK